MKTVQIIRTDTEEIITSITEYEDGIKGITADGYEVYVDGEKLKQGKKRIGNFVHSDDRTKNKDEIKKAVSEMLTDELMNETDHSYNY